MINKKLRYRGKYNVRESHPKIWVWAHTDKAEIEYFLAYGKYLRTDLLMPRKKLFRNPIDLINWVVEWKNDPKNIDEKDGDQVWCVFDVDDFYKKSKQKFNNAIENARKNGVRIAFFNECFELWILLHFEKPTRTVDDVLAVLSDEDKEIIKERLK